MIICFGHSKSPISLCNTKEYTLGSVMDICHSFQKTSTPLFLEYHPGLYIWLNDETKLEMAAEMVAFYHEAIKPFQRQEYWLDNMGTMTAPKPDDWGFGLIDPYNHPPSQLSPMSSRSRSMCSRTARLLLGTDLVVALDDDTTPVLSATGKGFDLSRVPSSDSCSPPHTEVAPVTRTSSFTFGTSHGTSAHYSCQENLQSTPPPTPSTDVETEGFHIPTAGGAHIRDSGMFDNPCLEVPNTSVVPKHKWWWLKNVGEDPIVHYECDEKTNESTPNSSRGNSPRAAAHRPPLVSSPGKENSENDERQTGVSLN